MKEKVIFTLSLACFIGIMWLSTATQTTNVISVINEEQPILTIDDISPEITSANDVTPESDVSSLAICSLKPIETDAFTFGDAFQHYRQCLGSDSSFQWKGNIYTTFLSEEVIIQVADSVQVNGETEGNNQVSEIH